MLLCLFPLHFFFHFLFYTDVGSVAFVLAAYLVRKCMHNLEQTCCSTLATPVLEERNQACRLTAPLCIMSSSRVY